MALLNQSYSIPKWCGDFRREKTCTRRIAVVLSLMMRWGYTMFLHQKAVYLAGGVC